MADMLIGEADVGDVGLCKEEDDRFFDESFFAIAEEIADLTGIAGDQGDLVDAGFFQKLAAGCGEIGLAGFEMTLGEIPVGAVIQQKPEPLGRMGRINAEDEKAGRSLSLRHETSGTRATVKPRQMRTEAPSSVATVDR